MSDSNVDDLHKMATVLENASLRIMGDRRDLLFGSESSPAAPQDDFLIALAHMDIAARMLARSARGLRAEALGKPQPLTKPRGAEPITLTFKEVLEGAERAEARVNKWPEWKRELSPSTWSRLEGDHTCHANEPGTDPPAPRELPIPAPPDPPCGFKWIFEPTKQRWALVFGSSGTTWFVWMDDRGEVWCTPHLYQLPQGQGPVKDITRKLVRRAHGFLG